MELLELKKLYQYLNEEMQLLVSNEVYNVFEEFRKAEKAYIARTKYHRAYYSLDRDAGIEAFSVHKTKSPDTILKTKEVKECLIKILDSLPTKQVQRIYRYFYLEITLKEIAEMEGASITAISQSIVIGLRTMRKHIEISSFAEEYQSSANKT